MSPEAWAAIALVALYLAVMSGHVESIDGLLMYRQSLSLGYDHSLHFHHPIWWGGWYNTTAYPIGLSILYLPTTLLAFPLHGMVPFQTVPAYDWRLFYDDPLYALAGAPLFAIITALSAYAVGGCMRELGAAPRTRLWGMLAYGVASPALVYARGDFSQPLEALCWIGAIYLAIRYRRQPSSHLAVLTGLAAGSAVLVRPIEGTVLLPAVLALMLTHFDLRRVWRRLAGHLGVVGGFYLAAVGLTLLVNWGRFGSPFTTGYPNVGWTAPLSYSLPSCLFSPGWGLFWEFPLAVLLPLGIRFLWMRREGWQATVLVGLVLAQLLNVAGWFAWYGGWNWGLRLFLPALPVVAVIAACGIEQLPGAVRTVVPGALSLLGLAWSVPAVLTDLLAGYGGTYAREAESGKSFDWHAHPALGAWAYIDHWFATASIDSRAIDIVWFRNVHNLGAVALAPLILFLILFCLMMVQALRSERSEVPAQGG